MPSIADLLRMPIRRAMDETEVETCARAFLVAWDERIESAFDSVHSWTDERRAFLGRLRGNVLLEGTDPTNGAGYALNSLMFDGEPLALVRLRSPNEHQYENQEVRRGRVRLLDRALGFRFEQALSALAKQLDGPIDESSLDDDADGLLDLSMTEVADPETGAVTFLPYRRLALVSSNNVRSHHGVLILLGEVEDGRTFLIRALGPSEQEELPVSRENGVIAVMSCLRIATQDMDDHLNGMVILHLEGGDSIGLAKDRKGIKVMSVSNKGIPNEEEVRGEGALARFEEIAEQMLRETLGSVPTVNLT